MPGVDRPRKAPAYEIVRPQSIEAGRLKRQYEILGRGHNSVANQSVESERPMLLPNE